LSTSARLARFAAESADDPHAALEALRRELEASRGPLVEPIDGSDDVLVTFVYIADVANLELASQLAVWEATKQTVPMTRVAGTGVWHHAVRADRRVATTYQFQVDPPKLYDSVEELAALLEDPQGVQEWARRIFAASRADPFNPHRSYPIAGLMGADPERSAPEELWDSVLTLPGADAFPYLDGPPRAVELDRHVFEGRALEGRRDLGIYLPPGYDPGRAYPVVVMLDGEFFEASARAPEVLDAAISAGDLPPLVGVLWHNVGPNTRMIEMACNPGLPAVLADELLPWLRKRYAIADDPALTVVAGMSYGGLASTFVGLERPDAFGAALIMSPSLWYAPDGERGEWLTREYVSRTPSALRLFVAVGTLESAALDVNDLGDTTMVDVARRFAEEARAAGYDVVGFREQPGGHEFVTVQRVLPIGLAALLSA
jgi:enterochelin esterase family protein